MHYRGRSRRERYSGEPLRRLRIGFAVCLIAILTGVGIAFLIDRPTFSTDRRNTSAPIAAVTQAVPRSGGLEGTQTVLNQPSATPTRSPDAPIATTVPANQATPSTSSLTSSAARPTAAAVLPTSEPLSATVVLQRVAAAEAAVRTGKLEATIDYGGGNRSSAQVRFDLGDQQRPPRFHITSVYEGTSGVQTVERITIGDRAWQRQANAPWTEAAAEAGAADQVSVFLPHAESISNAEIAIESKAAVLRWHDASGDVDLTLTVNPTTGVPRELREVIRSTGATRTVIYSGWNTAVEDITPPD